MRRSVWRCMVALAFVLLAGTGFASSNGELDTLLNEYREYYQTLSHFSDKAMEVEDMSSPAYQEIYLSGHFCNDQLRDLAAQIRERIDGDPDAALSAFKRRLQQRNLPGDSIVMRPFLRQTSKLVKERHPETTWEFEEPLAPAAQREGTAPAIPGLSRAIDTAIAAPVKVDFAPSPRVMNQLKQTFFSGGVADGAPASAFNAYRQADDTRDRQLADTIRGWVSGAHVVRAGDTITVKATTLNVRQGPGTEHAVLSSLKQGAKAKVLAEQNGWLQIEMEGGAAAAPTPSGKYYKINLVQGNVPFLSQMDGFLRSKEVILTFDDGPTSNDNRSNDVYTSLKKYGAEAVFFVLGSSLESSTNRALVKAGLAAKGNFAVHGYGHATTGGKPFTAIPWATVKSDLQKTMKLIESCGALPPVFFRPPYGIIRSADMSAIISELKLVPVGWTIDSLDWSTKDPNALFTKVTGMIAKRGKGIVLMHDIHSQSRAVVPRLLEWLKGNGYTVAGPERLLDGFRASQ